MAYIVFWYLRQYLINRFSLFLVYVNRSKYQNKEKSLKLVMLEQGRESCDLLCTCIRTERLRKLFIYSLSLNKFSCCKMLLPCLRKQQTNIEVFKLYTVVFYTTSRKEFLTLLEIVWKNTTSVQTTLRWWFATKSYEVPYFFGYKTEFFPSKTIQKI